MTTSAAVLQSSALIGRYLAEPFIRREWLAERVEKHFEEPDCRQVLITAEPGMGKSALMAWLSSRHAVTPRYFIRLDSLSPYSSGDAVDLLLAIGHQLALQCPDAFDQSGITIDVSQRIGRVDGAGEVTGVRVEKLLANPFVPQGIKVAQELRTVAGEVTGVEVQELVASERLRDPQYLQQLALIDPARLLSAIRPEARILVLVDALDELRHRAAFSGWTAVDWLAECPALPENVRIVATSRPDEELLRCYLDRQRPYLRRMSIDPSSPDVRHDLAVYAARIAGEDDLRRAAANAGVDLVASTKMAAQRAMGNFLFLVSWQRGVRAAAQKGRWDDLRTITAPDAIPTTLTELYQMFIRLLREAVRHDTVVLVPGGPGVPVWDAIHWPVLRALAVARAPLSVAQLGVVAGLADRMADIETALVHMRQLLTHPPESIAYYHGSLPEHLAHPLTRAVWDHYIDPTMANLSVATRMLSRYGADWKSCDDLYALGNVVAHFVSSLGELPGGSEDSTIRTMRGLLSDSSFIQRVSETLGADNAINDFVTAHRAVSLRSSDDAQEIARTLAGHSVVATALGTALHADALQANLAYRRDCAQFYVEVLRTSTQDQFIASVLGDGDFDVTEIKAEFVDALVNHLRRTAQFSEANELVQLSIDEGRERSKTLYERGYLSYLTGDVDGALSSLGRSVLAADRCGDDVGRWISDLVHDQVAFQAGRLKAATYRNKLEQAIVFFGSARARSHQHASRWLLNTHSHLFDLACLTEDQEQAEREWELLSEDEWIQGVRPEIVLRWESRLLLVRGDFASAAARYERLLETLSTTEPEPEGIARDHLDYGRALSGLGRYSEARDAWNRAVDCPNTNGAWPWQRRAKALLASEGDQR